MVLVVLNFYKGLSMLSDLKGQPIDKNWCKWSNGSNGLMVQICSIRQLHWLYGIRDPNI